MLPNNADQNYVTIIFYTESFFHDETSLKIHKSTFQSQNFNVERNSDQNIFHEIFFRIETSSFACLLPIHCNFETINVV